MDCMSFDVTNQQAASGVAKAEIRTVACLEAARQLSFPRHTPDLSLVAQILKH